MPYTEITAEQFTATEGLDDWRVVLRTAETRFRAPSFPAAGRLVAAIADAGEAADHHPDVSLTYPGLVRVALTTHAVDGLSTHDVDLARHISQLAADAGATAEPTAAQILEIAIDTMDADRIRPFWAAVLDYREQPDGSLSDPRGFGTSVWFQPMDEPRTDRNRFHLDVEVPHDLAQRRLDAALAAGGTLVTDEYARAFWVLADAEGNEVCVCTWQDRSAG
ncbi:MAG: VOC family protein [Acidimicrobiales bacterium]